MAHDCFQSAHIAFSRIAQIDFVMVSCIRSYPVRIHRLSYSRALNRQWRAHRRRADRITLDAHSLIIGEELNLRKILFSFSLPPELPTPNLPSLRNPAAGVTAKNVRIQSEDDIVTCLDGETIHSGCASDFVGKRLNFFGPGAVILVPVPSEGGNRRFSPMETS